MILKIYATSNNIKLIQWLRKLNPSYSLIQAKHLVMNLPYIQDNQLYIDDQLRSELSEIADFDYEYDLVEDVASYNCNINPPQEYVDAMVWYDTLSVSDKDKIDVIVRWQRRPAVC